MTPRKHGQDDEMGRLLDAAWDEADSESQLFEKLSPCPFDDPNKRAEIPDSVASLAHQAHRIGGVVDAKKVIVVYRNRSNELRLQAGHQRITLDEIVAQSAGSFSVVPTNVAHEIRSALIDEDVQG